MGKDPFKEYLLDIEPTKKELGHAWYTAIGLQKVDGLDTSNYLKDIAIQNINGKISIDDAEMIIKSYYSENENQLKDTFEADIVSVNIAKTLSDKSFVFSPTQYLQIHKSLFENVFSHAGKIRTYNISKKEWVLDGDTVIYGGASLLNKTLEYDFTVEKNFDYSFLTKDDFIKHISKFISNLWQIHVFAEGNTRTTAVFLIKYLRKFGYDITNDIFAENAWYFRNALVRANYTNINKGIYETTKYLELFLRNLLFKENNELKNRYLHINYTEKVDIERKKVDIERNKVDINSIMISNKTKKNVIKLYNSLKSILYFGRTEIIEVLSMSNSGASKLISLLIKEKIIIPVKNNGKGKYCFNIEKINFE